MKITGVILMIVGIVALIYGGIHYTTQKRAVYIGPIQIDKTEHHTIPLSPLVGVACLAAGGLMIYAGGRAGR